MSNSNIPTIDILTDTWQTVITRTNSLITSLSNEVMTANSTNGITGSPISPRNATLFGEFSANSILVNGNTFSVNSTVLTIGNNLKISANNSTGITGYVLTSGGAGGNVYWSQVSGTVRSVANGVGLLGGTITNSGTLSVDPGDGIVVDSRGVSVNTSIITAITDPIPKKLTYGIRSADRTQRQAANTASNIVSKIVGFAQSSGTTGGSAYATYFVASESKDPTVPFSWGWALDQVTQNGGGTIQFDTRGHFDIVYESNLYILNPNVTIIAPGRNATFWFDSLDAGLVVRSTNIIFAYIEFRTLPGPLNNDLFIPCTTSITAGPLVVNTYPKLASTVLKNNLVRFGKQGGPYPGTPQLAGGAATYTPTNITAYTFNVVSGSTTIQANTLYSDANTLYVADAIKNGEHKLVSVAPQYADQIAFIGCEFRHASDGACDISYSRTAQPITITVGTSNTTISCVGHTFNVGDPVFFSNSVSGTLPSGLTPRARYYVGANSTDSFVISSTTPGFTRVSTSGTYTGNTFVSYSYRSNPDQGCRVTIQDSIYWDTDQPSYIGGSKGNSTSDPVLIQATLYNNIFAYCGERQPKVLGFSQVDMAQCYTLMLPFQRDNAAPITEYSINYGILVGGGGRAKVRGCLWSIAGITPSTPVSNTFAAALLANAQPNTDIQYRDGAIDITNSYAENSMYVYSANASYVPSVPYSLTVTNPPATTGTDRDTWVNNRWAQAGAKVDAAPEGLYLWYDQPNSLANSYPNGETVLVERNKTGRWIKVDETIDPRRYIENSGSVLNVTLPNGTYISATANDYYTTANGTTTRIAGINSVNQLYMGAIDSQANVGRVIVQSAEVPNSDLYLVARGDAADVLIYANNNFNSIFTADGKVGIGISSPGYTLDINGDLNVRGSTTANTGTFSGLSTTRTNVTSPAETDGNIFSGTYTPTMTAVSNMSTYSLPTTFQYMRVGNTVTVSGVANLAAVAIGSDTSIELSLPISSGLTNVYQVSGTAVGSIASGNGQYGVLLANSVSDNARIRYQATRTDPVNMYLHFTYRVL